MNKMTRVLLLLISLLAVAFTASAASKPTIDVQICVGLQGSRSATYDEPVKWELRKPGTTSIDYSDANGGTTSAVIDSSTKGCFGTIGVPNTVYDLYIKGADHLGKKVANFAYPAAAGTTDLSATVTLLDGDADGNNSISSADLSILAARLTFPANAASVDPRADFDENKSITSADLSILGSNLTFPAKTGDTVVAATRSISSPSTVGVGCSNVLPALTAGQTVSFEVVANVDQELDTIQFILDYDESVLTFNNMTMGSGFNTPGLNVKFTDPTNGQMLAFSAARSAAIGSVSTGQVVVATINFTATGTGNTTLAFVNNNAVDETGTLAYLIGVKIGVNTTDCQAGSVIAPAPTTVGCISQTTLTAGQSVSIPVLVNVSEELDTVQFIMDYDETALTFTGMTMGSGFNTPGLNLEFPDPTNGKMLAFSAARSAAIGSVSTGQLTLATVNFTVVKDTAPTNLTFVNNNAVDENGTLAYLIGVKIPVVTSNCTLGGPTSVGLKSADATSNSAFTMASVVVALVGMTTYTVVRRRYNA